MQVVPLDKVDIIVLKVQLYKDEKHTLHVLLKI